MILWFAGGACLLVWAVLHDPRLDYRVLVAGALLPEVAGVHAHSVLVSVAVLFAVMALTRGDARRRWLALPIGMFAHLVLDAVWTNTTLFWWPASGWSLAGERLPSLTRPVWVVVAQEVAGLAAAWWMYRRLRVGPEPRRGATC